MIEVEAISAEFRDMTGGEIRALQSVSMRLDAGKFHVIIGPSGSGKTTLIQILAGILKPTSGRITVNSEELTALGEGRRDAWRLRNCGLIFQDFRLIDELSPLENVLVPSWFTNFNTTAAHRQKAESLLEHFQVPARSGPVSVLSRGQQQRVAMARALLLDPPVILADEPTASVDKDNAHLIIDELARLAHAGKVVICVSHDDRVARRADHIYEIRDGLLIAEETPEQFAARVAGEPA